jgi:hypothetical protein
VTRGARLTWNIDVRILQAVTAETPIHHRMTNRHALGAGSIVTRRAVVDQRTVRCVLQRYRSAVGLVREAEISTRTRGTRLPCHLRLYHAVMTCCAASWIGPYGLTLIHDACVTRDAQRENPGVLLVRKPILSLPARERRSENCARCKKRDHECKPRTT